MRTATIALTVSLCVAIRFATASSPSPQEDRNAEGRGLYMKGGDHPHRKTRSDDTSPLESVVAQLSQTVSTLEAELQATTARLQTLASQTDLQGAKGSTFIRWGRSSCPANTDTVYSGMAGGSHYTTVAEANRLCLTLEPVFDDIQSHDSWPSRVYGAEYRYISDLHQLDVKCCVCRTPHPTTIMLPGTNVCPAGWTVQYSGHLTGAAAGDGVAEYLCLDGQPEGSNPTHNYGPAFRYTLSACGSLPCPPYVSNRVVTCAVCSM